MCRKIFSGLESGLSVCVLGAEGVSGCGLGFVFVVFACVCMLFRVCIYVVWRGDWYVDSACAAAVKNVCLSVLTPPLVTLACTWALWLTGESDFRRRRRQFLQSSST